MKFPGVTTTDRPSARALLLWKHISVGGKSGVNSSEARARRKQGRKERQGNVKRQFKAIGKQNAKGKAG